MLFWFYGQSIPGGDPHNGATHYNNKVPVMIPVSALGALAALSIAIFLILKKVPPLTA